MARIAGLGGMASAIAGTMAADGLRQMSQGRRPELRDLLLTPANMSRLANQLARMRGAAMKVGQLISMDAGELLPPELAGMLARLRADADYMPPRQLRSVLTKSWGENWLRGFAMFNVRPIAAASIGQVHSARTCDGRDLAVKIQYPGVHSSIDSDVRNVAALLRLSGLVPAGFDLDPLLDEARRQLHEEADYAREAAQLARFANLLRDDPDFEVPAVHADLTTPTVLAMTYLEGAPIESLSDARQEERDRAARLLLSLALRELFEFQFMQTDPNFANFRYNGETGRIGLLDFGAARGFSSATVARYRALLRAGLGGRRETLHAAALEAGLFSGTTAAHHQAAVLEMLETVFAALRAPGPFDFAASDVAVRLRDAGMTLAAERDFLHVPPMDLLYLQRKFGGLYLLASRLGARVDMRRLLEPYV